MWCYDRVSSGHQHLIGCAAKAAGLTMVTDNVQHLSRIDGLEVEDWIQR